MPNDDEGLARVRERIAGYMTKAMREAKIHTSWLNPNDEYEKAVERFVEAIVDRRRSQFLTSFLPFQARVAELGIYNSLSQLAIKMTAPGVPDFYQGTEFWDLHLVDPDNRRPVDYDRRREVLAALDACATPAGECAEQLLAHRADGRVKLFVDDARTRGPERVAGHLRARRLRAAAGDRRAPRVPVRLRAYPAGTDAWIDSRLRRHLRAAAGGDAGP